MDPLLERARIWFPTLEGSEQDLYQTAWASLLSNGRPIENLEKYLASAVYSAGLKELRRRRRRPVVSLSGARFRNGAGRRGDWQQGVDALADPTAPLPEEQIESREEAWLLSELLDELTPLQRRIIKLRWGCGVPRRDAAALVGISERSLRREVEKAEPVIAKNVELVRAGRWCEPKKSLVVAYCLGLLGPGRAAKARKHLEHCAACRDVANAMHGRLKGLAAVLPLPTFIATSSSHGIVARAAELGDSVRSGLADLATGVKHNSLALFTRTPAGDTAASQVAVGGGLRGSGSAIAALTACVVAGGGATYCAVEGVPSAVRDVAEIEQTQRPQHEKSPTTPEQPANTPAAVVPVPAPEQGGREPATQPQTESKSQQTDGEFAPMSPAPANSKELVPTPAARTTRAPVPTPQGGGSEFAP